MCLKVIYCSVTKYSAVMEFWYNSVPSWLHSDETCNISLQFTIEHVWANGKFELISKFGQRSSNSTLKINPISLSRCCIDSVVPGWSVGVSNLATSSTYEVMVDCCQFLIHLLIPLKFSIFSSLFSPSAPPSFDIRNWCRANLCWHHIDRGRVYRPHFRKEYVYILFI